MTKATGDGTPTAVAPVAAGAGPGAGFAEQAGAAPKGVAGEFVDFLKHNKKWWLTPIIVVLLLFGVLLLVGGTVVAPFIYTLF